MNEEIGKRIPCRIRFPDRRSELLKKTLLRCAAILLSILLLSACESQEAANLRTGADPDGPSLEISFYKKYSKKTGKRRGRTDEFAIGKKSRVRAFVDLVGLQIDRDYTLHLVWIRPDGKEIYRKYGELRLSGQPGEYTGLLEWKNAEKLFEIQSEEMSSEDLSLSLYSSLSLAPDRNREPGIYRYRVYLDRRLVREAEFTVTGAAS